MNIFIHLNYYYFFLYTYNMTDFTSIKIQFENCKEYKGKVSLNEPLAQKTTFKIGGNAAIYFEPEDFESLTSIIKALYTENILFFILGGGSNIVISDKGFDCAVISTNRLNKIEFSNSTLKRTITCYAGSSMASFINFCKENCLSGSEVFAGLPGSLGGAIYMNARCFETSINELLQEVTYLDLSDLTIKNYIYNQNDWAYKVSPFQNAKKIILKAELLLEQKSNEHKQEITALCKKYTEERISKGHFKFPSAGSVFRNNRDFGAPSGKIIEECGLRGRKVGGAQVAPWHGNFIINIDKATQKDVKNLVDIVVNEVELKKGITLQTEIIFCGTN